MAMLGVSATLVLAAFDSTIIATMLPRVAEALDGMDLYAWVGTGYMLSTSIAILIFGRLGDMYGRQRLMLTSVVILALGGLLCATAQNMAQLVLWRALQGVGGGMMIATAFAAPADLFPDTRQRVRWMAMLSAAYAVASGIGPFMGGAITEALGWRATFLLVTPLTALAAFVLLFRFFPDFRPRHDPERRIDWRGAGLLALALGAPLAALELGLAPGEHSHPWLALTLLACGLVALAVLIPLERRLAWPIFPLRILALRQTRLLTLVSVYVGATMFILIYYSPLLLQQALGYEPGASGLLITPLVVAIPIGSIINGRIFPRQTEPQRLLVFGSLLLAVGCLMTLFIGQGSPVTYILLAFFVSGLGLGFLLPNLTLIMQMLSDRRDIGLGSALVQTARSTGSAVGVTVLGLVIARLSVESGIRTGLACCIALALLCAWTSTRIKMKNLPD